MTPPMSGKQIELMRTVELAHAYRLELNEKQRVRGPTVTAPSALAALPDLLGAVQELMVRGPKVWQ